MAKRRLTSRLVHEVSSRLQDYKLSPRRASILAREIEALNRAVFDAARRIRFEDEPASFLVLMAMGKRSQRKAGDEK
jgi:hypothetical protein